MQLLSRICFVCTFSLTLAPIATAQSPQQRDPFEIELTGSWAAHTWLGSWTDNPDVQRVYYQHDSRDTGDGFVLGELRLAYSLGRFQLVARAEQSPELERSFQSSVNAIDGTNVIPYSFENRQRTTMRSYDLGIALPFQFGARAKLSPSLSATYFNGTSSLNTVCWFVDEAPSPCTFHKQEGQLGVALAVHASWELGRSVALVGDLVSRWARGDTVYSTTFFGSGTFGGTVVPVIEEKNQSRSIFGGEAGVRWQASSVLGLTAGWRYRDWSYDTGPGEIHGPFLRFSITMK